MIDQQRFLEQIAELLRQILGNNPVVLSGQILRPGGDGSKVMVALDQPLWGLASIPAIAISGCNAPGAVQIAKGTDGEWYAIGANHQQIIRQHRVIERTYPQQTTDSTWGWDFSLEGITGIKDWKNFSINEYQLLYDDSAECGGSNGSLQSGVGCYFFQVDSPTTLGLSGTGKSEWTRAGIEYLRFVLVPIDSNPTLADPRKVVDLISALGLPATATLEDLDAKIKALETNHQATQLFKISSTGLPPQYNPGSGGGSGSGSGGSSGGSNAAGTAHYVRIMTADAAGTVMALPSGVQISGFRTPVSGFDEVLFSCTMPGYSVQRNYAPSSALAIVGNNLDNLTPTQAYNLLDPAFNIFYGYTYSVVDSEGNVYSTFRVYTATFSYSVGPPPSDIYASGVFSVPVDPSQYGDGKYHLLSDASAFNLSWIFVPSGTPYPYTPPAPPTYPSPSNGGPPLVPPGNCGMQDRTFSGIQQQIAAGQYILYVYSTTGDGLYHVGANWRFKLTP